MNFLESILERGRCSPVIQVPESIRVSTYMSLFPTFPVNPGPSWLLLGLAKPCSHLQASCPGAQTGGAELTQVGRRERRGDSAYLCQVKGSAGARKDTAAQGPGHSSGTERGQAGASLPGLQVRAAPVPTACGRPCQRGPPARVCAHDGTRDSEPG